ncbi:HTH-type transcriptional regulator NmtR [Maioricimonas rarisocia]|uniref:HTH-type transcriptional regulator NmtR n=1 Tax=Maioricimonas rarisocia TaxID=2528026 RepID=A0A517YZS8_9PLAN|nr:metalloregulator ArsR/SmtB family transcription factor [Maioricimonas rarisocia]QDU35731.1 HTH-type transcriptional regulator NmtR [Maioricimonas rarisocia]
MATEPGTQGGCAGLLKILADETRLAVVRQLMDGPKHVGDINASLELEQSLLSHHLKVLREAGLVLSRRDGKAVLYSLAPEYRSSLPGEAIDLGCCLISFDDITG